MAGERRRHVTIMGLEVTDAASYARYRTGMTPTLEAYGGAFDWDLLVAKVLKGPRGQRLDRVFAISFPDAAARDGFFADPLYRAVRAEFFEPAVASVATLAEFDEGSKHVEPAP